MAPTDTVRIGRRAFLRDGTLILAAAGLPCGGAEPSPGPLRFGLVTDLHHADRPAVGSRHYRETLGKLAEAATRFQREKLRFVVELGDLIDAADSVATEKAYLAQVHRVFTKLAGERHHVLGNHCVDTLTKQEFLDGVEQKRSWYSFDHDGVHLVVLDACFRSDGEPYGRKNSRWNDANIPAGQIDWLREDLKAARGKVVVLVHQRLDVANDYGVKNAGEVRRVLEGSGKVLAVFQGHSHKNDHREIAGIHYCTLAAMVEGSGPHNNSYAIAEVRGDGTLLLTGFRRQKSHEWSGRNRE